MSASLAHALLDDLPDAVHELIALLGVPVTLAIIERYRGVRLYLPLDHRRVRDGHPLAQLIGVEPALKLARAYPGRLLPVPRCVVAMRALRDREIRRLHREDGWTAARCAQWAALTERQVYTILAASDARDDRQSVLF